VRLEFTPGSDFDFRSAVCSHGFFMLAPNVWDAATGRLETAIPLNDRRAVVVALGAAPRRGAGDFRAGGTVWARCGEALEAAERGVVRSAVRRMLRLDEDLSAFHARCRATHSHRRAAELRFGRLLASASLFEDMVKVICTCNTGWGQTVGMIERIVSRWGVPAEGGRRGFPTPARLARARPGTLRRAARVGYRADFISRLARDVAAGRLDLDALEHFDGPTGALHRRFRQIHGIGDYAAAHLCMLLGRYELWQGYIAEHGESADWSPAGAGRRITVRRD
jgi:hypothetical protein